MTETILSPAPPAIKSSGIKPVVAIVGRPNVGKSTLVNRIIGQRQAIVDDLPGVTRDRSYYDAQWQSRAFTLVDTGGIIANPDLESGPFSELVNQQVDVALAEADLVVLVMDGLAGLTPADEEVAQQVRKSGKPVLLVVNKIDTAKERQNIADFYQLGFGEPHPLSAMHGNVGVGDMLDVIIGQLPDAPPADQDTGIRLAFLGRPNVGKSSIVNGLLGETRTIVSEISGTTRDAIDTPFQYKDQDFTLVDTAGIRKRGKVDYGVELFSVDRALRAMRRADVTIVVLDATANQLVGAGVGLKTFITDQDKKIIEASNEAGRALVLVVNKWDLVESKNTTTTEDFKKTIFTEIPHARYAPVIFTSALTKQRLTKILDTAVTVHANWSRRHKTNLVNQVILEAVTLNPPPTQKNKTLKVLYATQVSVSPPTFIVFVNDDKLMKEAYRRYLEKKLRQSFELEGSPIVIIPRNRNDGKK